MRRKQVDVGGGRTVTRWSLPLLVVVSLVACSLAYLVVSIFFRRGPISSLSATIVSDNVLGWGMSTDEQEREGCCGGIDHLELWGAAVKWGTNFKLNSSGECCRACKDMCKGVGEDGPCPCDSWVFCGDKKRCKDKFGECWLKKQDDSLNPSIQMKDGTVMWTSGLFFGKGEGIIGLRTEHGTIHVKLFPECAPQSVAYIIELLGNRHCAGCRFYRAEGRGASWDAEGNHISDATHGPPYGLIQGTLEAEGLPFKAIPKEACPTVRSGYVSWVGSGPEFIISLANHYEWRRTHTVFGSVLPEDMHIAEKISLLPTKSEVWKNIQVAVLKTPVSFKLIRAKEKSKLTRFQV